MDEFSEWLSRVADLTLEQRQIVFYALIVVVSAEASEERPPSRDAHVCSVPSSTMPLSARIDIVPTATIEFPKTNLQTLSTLTLVCEQRIAHNGCPHCGEPDVIRWGRASQLQRYRCTECKVTFNALTGTHLAHLHLKDRWSKHAQSMNTGESLAKAAERCDVASTTAFRWRHRFLAALANDKPALLVGIVEADDTFVLESFKGKRADIPRKSRKRGGKAAKRGLSIEQIPVLVARDRTGSTIDAVLPKLDTASITAVLGGIINQSNELCCDGGKGIVGFARKFKIPYHILPAPGGPSPDAPELHINNVNGYHGRFKEWMRPFHGVATKYLPNYVSWRRTLEALGKDSLPGDWIAGAIGLGPYQQKSQ